MTPQFSVWLHSLTIIVAAYLFGSIPTGYLLMRFFRKQDIRSIGSGNIGATNVLRSGAKGLGAATFALDVLKGALAVLIGMQLAALNYAFPAVPQHPAAALAALCAVLGHMFPIWLNFRGGKGVATAFGVFLVLAPFAALGSIALFTIVFALSRYVSLASILGAAAFPVLAWFLYPPPSSPTRTLIPMAVILFVPALVIVKHHQNIQRLIAGTEYRFGSGKGKPPASATGSA
jgi:acyl phosphate:glycerol-3-phosphate acyltransferase